VVLGMICSGSWGRRRALSRVPESRGRHLKRMKMMLLLPEVPRFCLRRAISRMGVHQVLLLAGCCVEGNREAGQASRLEHQGPVSVLKNLVVISQRTIHSNGFPLTVRIAPGILRAVIPSVHAGRHRPLLGIVCSDRAHGCVGLRVIARTTTTKLRAQRVVRVGGSGRLMRRSGDAGGEGLEAATSCLHRCVAEGSHGEGMAMEMAMAQQLSSRGKRWIALASLPISCSLTPSHTLALSLSQQQRAHRQQAWRIWREEMLLGRVERRLRRFRVQRRAGLKLTDLTQ
jgi:hypothetical protein